MRLELINQSLKVILPEDLLQAVLKLQEVRGSIANYMDELKECNDSELKSLKWDRADDITTNINLAIVDLADLISIELASKIQED